MEDNVFRKQKVHFTQVPNELLYSSEISLKAKGLWAYMNAKPDDWKFSASRISEEVKEDRKAILAALRELVSNGYLVANKLASGRMEYILMWEATKDVHTEPTCSKNAQVENVVKSTTARPMRKDYSSDEEFEEAFYVWNEKPAVV